MTDPKPPAGERETPEQVAVACANIVCYWTDEHAVAQYIAKAIRSYTASLTTERDELKRKLVHIRGVLRKHEGGMTGKQCPLCHGHKETGHFNNCMFGQLLQEEERL